MKKYLTLWEFSKKQDYIFKSNKLIENVGASLIIKGLSENFKKYHLIEDNFIVKGGGKTLYIFEDEEEKNNFIKNFSINVLKNYPGVEIFIVTEDYDDELDSLKTAIDNIYSKLENKKSRRRYSSIQVGFGIEKSCVSTGNPASYFDDKEYISSEIKVKREHAKSEQGEEFSKFIPKEYKMEKSIDEMVSDKSKSYIAIVHIDGNGMGKKMRVLSSQIVKKPHESMKEYNHSYLNSIRNFSMGITRIYEEAFKKMTNIIEKNKEMLSKYTKINDKSFPLRPLIIAGDDITYISNGYIGVESSRTFIQELNKHNITVEGINLGKLDACAGVAIVKKGYPFIRAYDLAEGLCSNAKMAVLESGKEGSAIDFHISQGEINTSIHDIREKDYLVKDKNINLTMKPLFLDKSMGWRNYHNFIESLHNVENAMKERDIGRGKIKALREEFKKGPDATEMFFEFYNITGGKYLQPLWGTKGDYCFNTEDKNKTCMYLDAIEAMDYFVELKVEE